MKPGCPAVTLTTENPFAISVDVVPSLKVKSCWPDLTKDGFPIEKWLGRKSKQEYKRRPYCLVPKYEGNGAAMEGSVAAQGEFGSDKQFHFTLMGFSSGASVSISFWKMLAK